MLTTISPNRTFSLQVFVLWFDDINGLNFQTHSLSMGVYFADAGSAPGRFCARGTITPHTPVGPGEVPDGRFPRKIERHVPKESSAGEGSEESVEMATCTCHVLVRFIPLFVLRVHQSLCRSC